jgi:hypothetical protein
MKRPLSTLHLRWLVPVSLGGLFLLQLSLAAQPFVPGDVGTIVNGFQDDFDGSTLNPNWVVSGANVFSVSGGVLHVSSASGDPNHLLCEIAGYDSAVQEVLARVRVGNFGAGDAVRGGVAVGVDGLASQGINYLFRNGTSEGQSGNHFAMLDDMRAWGPGQAFTWQPNTWYWLRLRQEPNAASQGGLNDVFAKIWPADGSAPESASWQLTWNYTPTRSTRAGFAGITASSSGGLFEFDVDYILIKAAGLPAIFVAPESFVQIPVAITNQPKSQAVLELSPVSFVVQATGIPVPQYQWYRNNVLILDATNAAYTIGAAAYADNGAQFKVTVQNVVSNTTYAVTSSTATLTVIADTNPPVLLSAAGLGLTQVKVAFTERVRLSTATNLANFTLRGTNGTLHISSATLDATQSNVLLSVDMMTEGAVYTVTVNNVADQSNAGNIIAANSHTTFTAALYTFSPIGNPALQGGQVRAENGYDISGSGVMGATNDQFALSYQLWNGDFDVKVRLASLQLADAWSEAGLMAREDLTAGSRRAAALATPTISGMFFQSRGVTNGSATSSGSFPVNYPNTWLRLQRVGNTFSGFAGIDGQSWNRLGSASIAMPSSIYLGFAVSSHTTNQLVTAYFRDFSTITNVGTSRVKAVESLGQCSRRTSLVISEIMYNPPRVSLGADVAKLDFIELFNSRGEPEDISGYGISGAVDYTFPPGTVISGGSFLVVSRAPADLEVVYGISGVLGPWEGGSTNGLPNNGGTVRLRHRSGAVLLEINYSNHAPWPIAADGAGHSLVLASPSLGEGNPQAWAASATIGGSPGSWNPVSTDPLDGVLINEFLAHTDPPLEDYVELYNHSGTAKDLSGAWLSDKAGTNLFRIPDHTTLPPGGFVYYKESTLGFALSSAGERIFLVNSNQTRVIDAIEFGPQQNGVASGRVPDGGPEFYRLAALSPGTNNGLARLSPVVINELMFNPISRLDDDQYVELYNRSSNSVSVAGWRFTSGIDFTFPANTTIPAQGYLVVVKNAGRLRTNYANLNLANCLGDFSGKLSHGGERVALAMPEFNLVTNGNQVSTETVYIDVNEVTYVNAGRWSQWAEGGGSSLELIDPDADNRFPCNWADSDETAKAPWTVISATGTLDNGNVAADELQVLQQGAGECLVDDVQVLDNIGNNRIANSSFETDSTGWTAEGTESKSSWEPNEGYASAHSYHIRAVDRSDNQVNRVRTLLTSALAAGTTNVTISAKVRWLKGFPEVLLRLRGNWLECAGEMSLPLNCGTPGTRNIRATAVAPPAILDVNHAPVLPVANEPVVISARVSSPHGVSMVTLKYRLDPGTTYTSVPMYDNGVAPDDVAGDGIFTGTIPGQNSGTMIAFSVQATDGSAPLQTATFPPDAPTRECLVRVGEVQPTGNFPVYRIWMTQATLSTWNNRSKLNNTPMDITFVLANQRAIYNAQGLYAGSPYIAPGYCGATCGRCGYSITVPADNLFLGERDLVLDWPGGHGGETTAVQEQMGYWIADRMGLPFSHRYIIRLHVNGVTDDARNAAFEAVMQPDRSFTKEWMPDQSSGDFFKVDRAFEFNDGGGLMADPEPRLQNFTTTGGVKKREKYRWNWNFRAADRVNNYTNIFALVDALNAATPEPYTSATLGLVDIEEWMGILATEHIIVNFDAYGHEIGKNMYAFFPDGGKWQLYMFDLDWLMLAAARRGSSYSPSTALLFNADDPTAVRMYRHPPFARAYWRAVEAAVNRALDPAICNPVMDAKYASLVANGVAWCDGQALTDPSAVKDWFSQRRTALQNQLATVAAPFVINSANVSNNIATITGTAPIGAETISFNGIDWPLTWTSVTSWRATVLLKPGTNQLNVVGLDVHAQPVPGASASVTVVANDASALPAGTLVINELMYQPTVPGAEFVELFNYSSSYAFDLSGCVFHGLEYTFPAGSFIGPRGYLVLTKDRVAFDMAYGPAIQPFDQFSGTLQANGETLTLAQPATAGNSELVLAKVRYGSAAPWPSIPGASGTSLQLIDAKQDNWRVANWAAGSPSTPGKSNSLAAALPKFPALWLNELQAENLTGITNSLGQHVPWIELFNPTTNTVALEGLFLADSYSDLTSWAFPNGSKIRPGEFKLVFADAQTGLSTSNELHTSFALAPKAGSLALSWIQNGQPQVLDYIDYTNLTANRSFGSLPDGQSFERRELFYATPGASNNPASPPLTVVVNEWMASNTNTLRNPITGKFDDWFELYNYGLSTADLSGFYLTDAFADPFQFQIPPGYAIPPHGFLLVWADGRQTNGTPDLHVSFKMNKAGESLGLYGTDGAAVDFVSYGPQKSDISEGRFPDGAASLYPMSIPTPGTNNVLPNAPPVLDAIGDKTIILGQTLTFTATASDADGPSQPLIFSLQPEAPAGASVNPFSGVFSWTPSKAPSTNLVTLSVTDTGNPPLSASRTFNVYVLAPPMLQAEARNDGHLEFRWSSVLGQTYQLEVNQDLRNGSWLPVGGTIAGTGGPLSVTLGAPTATDLFYRLRVVP